MLPRSHAHASQQSVCFLWLKHRYTFTLLQSSCSAVPEFGIHTAASRQAGRLRGDDRLTANQKLNKPSGPEDFQRCSPQDFGLGEETLAHCGAILGLLLGQAGAQSRGRPDVSHVEHVRESLLIYIYIYIYSLCKILLSQMMNLAFLLPEWDVFNPSLPLFLYHLTVKYR